VNQASRWRAPGRWASQQFAEQKVSLMRPLLQVETEHLTIFEPHASGLRHIEHKRAEEEEGWAVMQWAV